MSFFSPRKFFQYYLPLTLIFFTTITIERNVDTDFAYDRLYGFPLPYISGNLGCTGCYEVYVLPLLINLLVDFSLIIIVFLLVEKIGLKIKTHWIFISIGVLVSLFCIAFFILITQESSFKLVSDIDFKTTSWRWAFLR